MTDWSRYDLRQIWGMLAAEGTNGTVAAQIGAWKLKHELLVDQAARLRRYRDDLAVAWPPERSAAAARFVERLNELITSMEWSSVTALDIRSRVDEIERALLDARTRVLRLCDQFADPTAMRVAWERRNPIERHVIPDGWRRAEWRAEWLEMLSVEARKVMASTDTRVREAAKFPALPTPRDDDRLTIYQALGPRSIEIESPVRSMSQVSNGQLVPARVALDPAVGDLGRTVPELAATVPAAALPGGINTVVGRVVGEANEMTSNATSPAGWMQRTASGQMALRPGGVVGGPVPSPTANAQRGSRSVQTPTGESSAGVRPAGEHRAPLPLTALGGSSTVRPPQSGDRRGYPIPQPTEGRARIVAISGWPQRATAAPSYNDPTMAEYVARRSMPRGATGGSDVWPVREGVRPVISPEPESGHDPGPGVIGIDR